MLTEKQLIDLLDKYNIKHKKATTAEVKALLKSLDKYMEEEFGISSPSDSRSVLYDAKAKTIYTNTKNQTFSLFRVA